MKMVGLFKSLSWNAPGRSLFSFILFFLFTLLFLSASPQSIHAQGLLSGKKKAAKSKEAADLTSMIPWSEITPDAAKTVREIIETKTVFRRMPMQTTFCDKKLYQFLMQHPDVVVGMWELMDVTEISLREVAPGQYKMLESTGSTGNVEILFQDANLLVAYCEGSFVAPMNPKPVLGETILILHSRFGTDGNGRPAVQSRMDCYVKIHNPGAELLAKLLVPVFGKVADANFEQIMGFVSSVSDVAEYDHESIQEISARLKTVRPAVAKEFAFVAEDVYERAAERFLIASGGGGLMRESVPLRKKENGKIREPAAPLPREAPISVAVRSPYSSQTSMISENGNRNKEVVSSSREKAPLPFPIFTPGSQLPATVTSTTKVDENDDEDEEELTHSVIIQSVSVNTSEFVNSVSRTPAAPALGKPKNIRANPDVITPSEPLQQVQKPVKQVPPKPTRIPVPVIP